MNKITIVMSLLVFGLAAESHGQDGEKPFTVSWETLALEEKAFNDPFAKLTPKQLQDVSYALRVGRLISEKKLSPESSDATKATKIAGDLKQQGFGLEWLMAQRRAVRKLRAQQVESHAATVTKKFQGQQITLYGFAVPISTKAKTDTEFFLVPSIDFCKSSTPPSTQAVYVKSQKKIEIKNRTTPVKVTGRLKQQLKQQLTHQMFVYPGRVINVEAEYAIKPTEVKVVDWQTKPTSQGESARLSKQEAADGSLEK